MNYEPTNVGASEQVLQELLAQLQQSRMKQRVRKGKRNTGQSQAETPVPDTPGRRIVLLRKQQKITQKALAEAVGITTSTLSKYETGKCPFRTDLLIRFAKELSTTTDFILCLSGPNEAEKRQDLLRETPAPYEKKSEKDSAEEQFLALFRSLSEQHQLLLIDMVRLFCKQVEENPECYPEVMFYQIR